MPLVSPQDLEKRLETLYTLVANEEDARVCRDLDDDACRVVPRNFFVMVAASILTKLGDALSSPKTVLAWLMSFVGAPAGLVALLVPIRESGSLLPQIFIGGFVRQRPLRKPIWIAGSLLQCAAVVGIGLVAATLEGALAGWLMLACLTVFALARGLNSVASKDLTGKTIPKGRRGRLGGIAASVSGALAVGVGVFMGLRGRELDSPWFYGGLLVAAGGLWLLAAVVFAWLKEYPGETEGGGSAWREAVANLALLRRDREFRRFVLTRSLLLCSALAAPFYVVLAKTQGGASARTLGTFIVANGLAASLSAPFWGIMADRSSRRVMIAAAVQTAALGIAIFLVIRLAPTVAEMAWTLPVAFFLLGIAHSGVRAGRKTYLVDLAGGVKRTDYVAVSNTAIGVVLLVAGGITGALSFLAPEVMILGLSLVGLLGAALARTLPEVE